MRFYITGDKHGRFEEMINSWSEEITQDPQAGVIILGDSGINFFKNNKIKEYLAQNTKCKYFVVRGNHDRRPEELEDITALWVEEVKGYVWYEPDYDNIYYLPDGGIYDINGYRALVIGGAYSVDKYYRLQKHWTWFPDEQLDTREMNMILSNVEGESFDLILTHTCPFENRPVDLFLPIIDQSTVDNTMEYFLSDVKKLITFKRWCFGHYHADRIEPDRRFHQFYHNVKTLEEVMYDEA